MGTIDHTPQTGQAGTIDMIGGATGPITKAISARRSHRRQWRIFECFAMITLDAILVFVAFHLAYYLRYTVFFQNKLLATFRYSLSGIENNSHIVPKIPTDSLTSFSYFQSLEIGIVIGLILIFALRGLYKIRLTGTWFRQVWTIVSSTTLGVAFLHHILFHLSTGFEFSLASTVHMGSLYCCPLLSQIDRFINHGCTLPTWSW